jgi:hypothetical protein
MPLTPVAYRKTAETHRRDTRANQPAASDVLEGTLYYVSDEGLMERSTGSVWEDVSDGVVGPDGVLANSLAIGTTPATVGALRLESGSAITARNAADTGNLIVLATDNVDGTIVGSLTGGATNIHSSGSVLIREPGITYNIDAAGFYPSTDNTLVVGHPSLRFQSANIYGITLKETTAPAAPAANVANLWVQDNGAGKTQLMVEFNTGGPIQIAIQP